MFIHDFYPVVLSRNKESTIFLKNTYYEERVPSGQNKNKCSRIPKVSDALAFSDETDAHFVFALSFLFNYVRLQNHLVPTTDAALKKLPRRPMFPTKEYI